MHLLQIAGQSVDWIKEIAFFLSLIICGLFLLEYKRFSAAVAKEEMLDGFLNDLTPSRPISGPSASEIERGEVGGFTVS